MSTYTVGHIINGGQYQFTRWLYKDGQELVRVDSNLGPVVLGEMTEELARERFPATFRFFDKQRNRIMKADANPDRDPQFRGQDPAFTGEW